MAVWSVRTRDIRCGGDRRYSHKTQVAVSTTLMVSGPSIWTEYHGWVTPDQVNATIINMRLIRTAARPQSRRSRTEPETIGAESIMPAMQLPESAAGRLGLS